MVELVEPILFPDVEELLATYLTTQFTARSEPATVHVRVPATRPDRFVLVPRLGGTRRGLVVDSATIGVECWADRDAPAFDLCALTRALVYALPGKTIQGAVFYRVDEVGGPANFPDPESNQSRYVFTVAVSVRGTAI